MAHPLPMVQIEPDAAAVSRRHKLKVRELRAFLADAKAAIGLEGELSALLATDETVRTLNRDFRGKDKATDVLSFPAADITNEATLAGDLAVSLDTAARQASEAGHPVQLEVKILLLHGLLHLAGYDHETDNGQMARKENQLRKEFQLPVGLIQRSSRVPVKSARKKTTVRKKQLSSTKGDRR